MVLRRLLLLQGSKPWLKGNLGIEKGGDYSFFGLQREPKPQKEGIRACSLETGTMVSMPSGISSGRGDIAVGLVSSRTGVVSATVASTVAGAQPGYSSR